MECNNLSYVLHDHLDKALDHAVRLWVEKRGTHLAYSQGLQNLVYQTELEITARVTN
jgi:hypothetical protein